MKGFLVASIIIATAHALSVYDVVLDEWKYYKANTNKNFRSSDEEYSRLKVFLQTKDLVARHNERFVKGLEDFTIGMNQFADWLPFEHVQNAENVTTRYMMETAELRQKSPGHKIVVPKGVQLPDKVDWNEYGAVNDVMDQENCGSCYAITSAGALEAQIFIKYHTLPRLSVQQIIDCSKDFGNDGCDGGTFGKTFQYLQSTGLTSFHLYPYETEAQQCRLDDKPVSDKVKTFYLMYDGDEEKLKYAVATYGPVAIGVNASPRTFQLYTNGIYSDQTCGPHLVHAVLLVGYGTDPKTNKDYWLIKNSWGQSWGEKGFMRLARNSKNLCGIGKLAFVPTIEE